jgi:hypothetical protein
MIFFAHSESIVITEKPIRSWPASPSAIASRSACWRFVASFLLESRTFLTEWRWAPVET